MLDKCDPIQAATQYLLFLLALHQGRHEAGVFYLTLHQA